MRADSRLADREQAEQEQVAKKSCSVGLVITMHDGSGVSLDVTHGDERAQATQELRGAMQVSELRCLAHEVARADVPKTSSFAIEIQSSLTSNTCTRDKHARQPQADAITICNRQFATKYSPKQPHETLPLKYAAIYTPTINNTTAKADA